MNNKNIVNNRTVRIGVVGLCLGVALSATLALCVEPPAVEWVRTYPTLGVTSANWVECTPDGGYVIAGCVRPDTGESDLLLVKTDSAGIMEWYSIFEIGRLSDAKTVLQTTEGGFLLVGTCMDENGSRTCVVKANAIGQEVWETVRGDSSDRMGLCAVCFGEDEFVITGFDAREGECLTLLDSVGCVVWEEAYPGNYGAGAYGHDFPLGVPLCVTPDHALVFSGRKDTIGLRLTKVDSTGGVLWERTYAGLDLEEGSALCATPDSGFAVLGTVFPIGWGSRAGEVFVLRTDMLGNTEWVKYYGDDFAGIGSSVQPLQSGGFIIAATVAGTASQLSAARVIGVDGSGTVVWQQTIENGEGCADASCARPTGAGGYVVVGTRGIQGGHSGQLYLARLR